MKRTIESLLQACSLILFARNKTKKCEPSEQSNGKTKKIPLSLKHLTAVNKEAVDALSIQQLVPISSKLIRNPKNAVRKQDFQENSRTTYLSNEISDIPRKWRQRVRDFFSAFNHFRLRKQKREKRKT